MIFNLKIVFNMVKLSTPLGFNPVYSWSANKFGLDRLRHVGGVDEQANIQIKRINSIIIWMNSTRLYQN